MGFSQHGKLAQMAERQRERITSQVTRVGSTRAGGRPSRRAFHSPAIAVIHIGGYRATVHRCQALPAMIHMMILAWFEAC